MTGMNSHATLTACHLCNNKVGHTTHSLSLSDSLHEHVSIRIIWILHSYNIYTYANRDNLDNSNKVIVPRRASHLAECMSNFWFEGGSVNLITLNKPYYSDSSQYPCF